MLPTIADHIKSHRHQVRQHSMFIGSRVIIPPDEVPVHKLIADMAIEWAGDRVEHLSRELQAQRALEMMAEEVPDHARRARLLSEYMEDARPAEGHIRLARLVSRGYFSTLFLAEPDRLFQEALQTHHLTAENDYHYLVAGVDEPETIRLALKESSRLVVVKCSGDLEAKYLPLTPEEIGEVYDNISDIIADNFRIFSVFVAYAERDRPMLEHVSRSGKQIHWVNKLVPLSDQRAFDELKVENPASVEYHAYEPEVVKLLEDRKSSQNLLCRDPGTFNEFMAKLHERLTRKRRSQRGRRDLTLLKGGPYRFLDHFRSEDTDFFFGREADTEALMERMADNPLTVLFGRSGVGKTSLLRAGIIGGLRKKSEEVSADEPEELPWLTVYARCLDDPIERIREATMDAVEEIGFEVEQIERGESLLEFMTHVHEATNRRIAVLVDQFEEYFVRLGDKVKENFLEELTRCLASDADYLHWVISLREDYVGALYDLHEQIPSIMHNMYRLKKLTPKQARDAIVKPAQNFELHLEQELVEILIEDLSRDGVDPAQLQIVCDRLYDAKPSGQHTLGLHTYQELGGASEILSEYLDYAISQFLFRDRRIARDILKHMASSSEVLATQPIERISDELGYSRDDIERVLARLVDFRLLRSLGDDRHRLYELVHDYVSEEVQDWMSEDEINMQDVQDLVARELNNYQKFGLLIGSQELRIINEHRENLNVSPEELELILRSVAREGEDVEYWFDRLDEIEQRRVPLLKELLKNDEPSVQRIAADVIADSPEMTFVPQLVRLLDSDDDELRNGAIAALRKLERKLRTLLTEGKMPNRVVAARALAPLESSRSVPQLIEALQDADRRLRDAVTSALVELEDAGIADQLLRRFSSREGLSWPGAYALAVIVSHHEEAFERLDRAFQDNRDSVKLLYAYGLAETYLHELPSAREHLSRAQEAAASSTAARYIQEAVEELEEREKKAAEATDIWTCFQGDAQHTGVVDHELGPKLKELWSFETKGPVMGSPVVHGNFVYIGSRDGNLYAVDAGRGTEHWAFDSQDQIETTPAIAEGQVFVAASNGELLALDSKTGVRNWSRRLGRAMHASPVVADSKVYVGEAGGTLTALSCARGDILWHVHTEGEVTSCPAIYENLVIFGSWDGRVRAFDLNEGREEWSYATDGAVASTPTVHNDIVCVGSDDANVYGLRAEDGEILWRRPVGGYVRSSAAAGEELFFIGCHDGLIYALEHDSGEIAWTAETDDEILASAAITTNTVFVGSIDGTLYALDPDSGEIRWSEQTLYGIYSTPAVVGNTLYIGMRHYNLVAYETAT